MLLRHTGHAERWRLMNRLIWREEWGRKQIVTHCYTVLLRRRASTCELGWEISHTHTHTPSWVPLPFLPPWRRSHWHRFLSLVSIVENRSLFSGKKTLQSGTAGTQTSVSTAPRVYNNLPQPYTAVQTHTQSRLQWPASSRQKHAESSLIQPVTFWLQHFPLLTSFSFKALIMKCFGRVRADSLAGSRFTLGESNRPQRTTSAINTQPVTICNIR